jgi:hypothetical protein
MVTMFLWVALTFIGPKVALMPLYAFYPGPIASGSKGYSPLGMHSWAAGAAAIFLALFLYGSIRNNQVAAVLFLSLFLISTIIIAVRFLDVLKDLH